MERNFRSIPLLLPIGAGAFIDGAPQVPSLRPRARALRRVIVAALVMVAVTAFPFARALAQEAASAGTQGEMKTPTDKGPSGPAPGVGDRVTGREHFARGTTLYQNGEYKLALLEFERAYALVPDYRVLYNIGQLCQQVGRFAHAVHALNRYLEEGGSSVPADRRKAILHDLNEMKLRTGYIAVTSSVDGADILVDGVVVSRTPTKGAILINAGEHVVEVRKEGMLAESTRIKLLGEDRLALALSPKPIPRSEMTLGRTAFTKTESDPRGSSRRIGPWTWAGWAVTGASIIGAGVAGTVALSSNADIEEELKSREASRERLDELQDRLRVSSVTADILAGVAVVTGITSLYFTLRGTREKVAVTPVTPTAGGFMTKVVF